MKTLLLVITLLAGLTCLAQLPGKDSTAVKVYLSFDDGPLSCSDCLVEIAARDSIPLNLFVVGYRVVNSEPAKKLLEAYQNSPWIKIFNHSFSHADKKYKQFYKKPAKVTRDILLNQDTLKLKEKIARLPGRNTWRVGSRRRSDLPDASAAADSLTALGFSIIGWDLAWTYDTSFISSYTGLQMKELVLTSAKRSFTSDHVVILCHDFMLQNEYSRQELISFIKEARKAGLKFGFLSSYPGIIK
jgi:peptidoglycan/xylan/chitin deacetylase (PgdA/CDA1 family)